MFSEYLDMMDILETGKEKGAQSWTVWNTAESVRPKSLVTPMESPFVVCQAQQQFLPSFDNPIPSFIFLLRNTQLSSNWAQETGSSFSRSQKWAHTPSPASQGTALPQAQWFFQHGTVSQVNHWAFNLVLLEALFLLGLLSVRMYYKSSSLWEPAGR